jgi:hypothetical protein
VRILKDFKSFVLELHILKGLESDSSYLRILKDLAGFFGKARALGVVAWGRVGVEEVTKYGSTKKL